MQRAVATLKPFAKQVLSDAKDIFPAPVLRWHRHEWTRFGEGVALVLAANAADNQIVRFVSRQQNPRSITTWAESRTSAAVTESTWRHCSPSAAMPRATSG